MEHLHAALRILGQDEREPGSGGTFTEDQIRQRAREAKGVKLELSHADLPYFTQLPYLLRESARFSWQGRPQALIVEVMFPDETVDALQAYYPNDSRAHAIAQLIAKGGGSFVYAPRPNYMRGLG